MSEQEEYKNGHGREPDKKPDIGHDDVENLIDFSDSDDEEEIEELPGSIEMQVVDEAAQLLAQAYNSDETEEMPGDLPEVLYEFDPQNQIGESLEEQVVVEQQVLDFAEVLIEMVEERYEHQLIAEEQDQIEIACDKAEQEPPPQNLMVTHGVGNSSNQGLDVITQTSESRSGQDPKDVPSESGQSTSDQVRNGEPLRSRQDPAVEQNLTEILEMSVQGLKEGPSRSGQGRVEPGMRVESGSDQGALVQNLNERQSRSSHEYSGESPWVSNKEILNGGPPRSDKDPIEQQVREDTAACEEVIEQLELEDDDVEVNVQAHPIRDTGIERHPNLVQDVGLRDQMVEAADAVKRADLNGGGGPESRPDKREHIERVGQVAANEEVVAPLEAGHVEAAPDQNEDILLDEQDNLVEEADGVQILPGPLEGEIGGQENMAAEEPDIAAEAQLIQKTE